jgi:3-methylcrotonyl-CoA carboxylase alpha subunit
MIAKLIVWGKDRLSAHRKLLFSLNKLVCLGVKTNQQFLSKIISNTDFSKGDYDTSFIDKKIDISELLDHSKICIAANLIASSIYDWKNRQSKRTLMSGLPSGWRNNYYSAQTDNFIFNDVKYQVEYKFNNNLFIYTINNISYNVYIHEASEDFLTLEIEKIQYKFKILKSNNTFHIHNELFGTANIYLEDRFPIKIQEKTKGTYRAPMPSQIVKVLVKTGQKIKNGDSLIVLSSMKMENTICADEDGTVEEIYINEGDSIEADTTLIKITD